MKLKYTHEENERLYNLLYSELVKAEQDYKRKKLKKGEEIDSEKMRKAINQRKKLKVINKLCLASTFSLGNILDKPEINLLVEKLEKDAFKIYSKPKINLEIKD